MDALRFYTWYKKCEGEETNEETGKYNYSHLWTLEHTKIGEASVFLSLAYQLQIFTSA